MDVGVVQSASDGRPGVSAIQTSSHPIHLDARPNGTVVLRINQQRRHPWDHHRRALFGQVHWQLFPPLAGIRGAEHRRWFGPRKDGVRLDGINGQGPGVQGIHR